MPALLTYFIGFAVAISVMILATKIVDIIIKAPGYQGEPTEHFDGKQFHNISKIKARSLLDVFKWALTENPEEWQQLSRDDVTIGEAPKPSANDGEISITFVNHATFLIQVGECNILTDPVWSKRASPFQWIGPKRMRPPGINFEDLPQIDFVFISHNHYDHLDIHTVKKLSSTHDPLFVVPLGVSHYLKKHGVHRIAELGWWQDKHIADSLRVTSVPAQHFSGRGLSDRDKTLWCGYILETTAGTLYFAGDTGYDGIFTEIGRRFDIDLSFIPIGAYKPRWFMNPIHVDPEQAVQIHKEVNSSQSIGMHFGTFPLGDEGMHEPQADLKKAREKHNIPHSKFYTLEEGETNILHSAKIMRA